MLTLIQSRYRTFPSHRDPWRHLFTATLSSLGAPPPLCLTPGKHTNLFSISIMSFQECYINGNIIVCNFLRLTLLTKHNSLSSHPSGCLHQQFVSFFCWVVFHGMDIPVCLTIHPFKNSGLFLAVTNKAATHIHGQFFMCTQVCENTFMTTCNSLPDFLPA